MNENEITKQPLIQAAVSFALMGNPMEAKSNGLKTIEKLDIPNIAMYTTNLKMKTIFIRRGGDGMQRGNYQTRQQEAIVALFERSNQACMTADEVYRKLLAEGMDVGKTTVYRAITKLCDTGVLRRYAPQSSSEAAQYQYNPCRESHLHIRCSRCGAMEHLHCDEVEAFAVHIRAHHGFVLDEGRTMLCGLCQDCAQQQEKVTAE